MSIKFTVSVKDETFAGKVLNELLLSFKTDTITVRELIETRVQQEVDNYNSLLPEYYNGLVEPTDAEKTINGFKLKSKQQIDGEKQAYIALDAFLKNGYFVLIDNLQAESLEQQIQIAPQMTVSFVKLTPLIGG